MSLRCLSFLLFLFVPGCGAGAGANLADFAAQPPADLGPAPTCYALHFDGIAGSAVTPPLPDPPASFTLEAWIRAEAVVANQVVALTSRGDTFNTRDGYDLELDPVGAGGFHVVGDSRDVTLNSLQEAVSTPWTHLAGVFDAASGTLSFFLDGHLQSSTPTRSTAFPLQMAPLVIGGGAASCPCVFQGYIAEVRLSATARYAMDFMPAARLSVDSETLALYHLDESGGMVAHDASTNHADATLMDGAAFAISPVCR